MDAQKPASDAAPETAERAADVAVAPELSDLQERSIHTAASEVVLAALKRRQPNLPDAGLAGAAETTVMGAFVTLKRQGRLRACCGALGKPMPLREAVVQAAQRTATEDVRLPPISPHELAHLTLDVTLLYAFQPLESRGEKRVEEIEIGKHGLQIRRGAEGGLLLPVVAVEQGYDAEQFLEQVCRKANLPGTAWKDDSASIIKFQGRSIGGDFDSQVMRPEDLRRSAAFTVEQLRQLAEHCSRNLTLLRQGGTPSYYLAGAADGNVQGVAMTLRGEDDKPLTLANISLRKPMPLQATLFNLCDSAAKGLAGRPRGESFKVQVAVLLDVAMHGVVGEPSLEGVETAERSLMVNENAKTSWRFDPLAEPSALLEAAARDARVQSPGIAGVYSLATIASDKQPMYFDNVPRGQLGGEVRPPAVAGTFYPQDEELLQTLIDELLPERPASLSNSPAVMAPHAGLKFSGRIAAEVFAQVRIPDTVIVIGPKHTRFGVEWAVAPHGVWRMPGGDVAADPQLARKIVEAIPALELDAAAHAREHAIEVELPLLRALAPEVRVVGVALAGGNVERARAFGRGLASVIGELDEPPLLVISSDMNHYGTDAENRRLDELALQAMETLDSERLLETCLRHNISMCGVFPAICVMETLRTLGKLNRATRVGYATSAEVSGDFDRVVGYAGVLLD